jgi:hypothetical protein
VAALMAAFCLFVLTPEGITNRRVRPLVAQLLNVPQAQYSLRQMGYDRRRLKRKRLIRPVAGKLCYTPPLYGRRAALFLTKIQARIPRPSRRALDLQLVSHTPAAPARMYRM